jgi:bifunctional non-homologous end joining protein LigD
LEIGLRTHTFAACLAFLQTRFIEPQLPTLTEQPPDGSDWIHEIKHDGYRTLLIIERGAARAYTRNGFDWSDRYHGIIAAAAGLPCRSAILDGEVIVQDERGASNFEALQLALRFCPERSASHNDASARAKALGVREPSAATPRARLKAGRPCPDPA